MAKSKEKPIKHNLGGVNMSHDCWLAIKARYESRKKVDESFSAWVRRMLAAS